MDRMAVNKKGDVLCIFFHVSVFVWFIFLEKLPAMLPNTSLKPRWRAAALEREPSSQTDSL